MNQEKLKVYVAGPYTLGDQVLNVRKSVHVAEQIIATGFAVPYVPHLTMLWHAMSPQSYEYWLALDLEWLRVCDVLLRIPGKSNGADWEVDQAERLRIPVLHGGVEQVADFIHKLPQCTNT